MMGDRRRLRARRRGAWIGYRRNFAFRSIPEEFEPLWGYTKREFGGVEVDVGSGRKSGRPLFAVRDDDDGRVRVDGPDIQRRFAQRKLGGGMQTWV
jgi:hypothetical protein